MSKIFFFLNYIYFHTFLQPISSVPQKLIRVPYSPYRPWNPQDAGASGLLHRPC